MALENPTVRLLSSYLSGLMGELGTIRKIECIVAEVSFRIASQMQICLQGNRGFSLLQFLIDPTALN
jgi:hypothetical protein